MPARNMRFRVHLNKAADYIKGAGAPQSECPNESSDKAMIAAVTWRVLNLCFNMVMQRLRGLHESRIDWEPVACRQMLTPAAQRVCDRILYSTAGFSTGSSTGHRLWTGQPPAVAGRVCLVAYKILSDCSSRELVLMLQIVQLIQLVQDRFWIALHSCDRSAPLRTLPGEAHHKAQGKI